ncbi:hypothetical protein MNBD_NITROSPIRAE03-1004 [hydrothermal vent metagenome]|uniref:Uncharacterized protein n=1 Tax=hydrothermal vent metagenome TaxID=652676 RepID=A0A3B1DPS1_9ZZZZ
MDMQVESYIFRTGVIFFGVDARPRTLVTLCIFGSVILRIIVLGKPAVEIVSMTDIVLGGCFAF